MCWCAAQVKKITMHDVRRMGENYSSVSYAQAVHVARTLRTACMTHSRSSTCVACYCACCWHRWLPSLLAGQ